MTVSSFCLSICDGRVERERELDRNELLPVQNCQINTALKSRNIVCIAYFTNLFFLKRMGIHQVLEKVTAGIMYSNIQVCKRNNLIV